MHPTHAVPGTTVTDAGQHMDLPLLLAVHTATVAIMTLNTISLRFMFRAQKSNLVQDLLPRSKHRQAKKKETDTSCSYLCSKIAKQMPLHSNLLLISFLSKQLLLIARAVQF